jgi:hypothetical protein
MGMGNTFILSRPSQDPNSIVAAPSSGAYFLTGVVIPEDKQLYDH